MGLGLTECEPRKISRFDCIHIVDMITSFFCVERGKSNKCRKSVHTHGKSDAHIYKQYELSFFAWICALFYFLSIFRPVISYI